jgi:hypothetical protein
MRRRDGVGEEESRADLACKVCSRSLQANQTPLKVKRLPKRLPKLQSKPELKISIQANQDDRCCTKILEKDRAILGKTERALPREMNSELAPLPPLPNKFNSTSVV